MNKFFYHYIIKNNFEKFEKYLTKKDGKNLITCKASLFLEKIISKLKNDTANKLPFDPQIRYFDPQIRYFTPAFKRYNFFSYYPKISYRHEQDKPPPNTTSKPKPKKIKSRKNHNRSSKNRNRKNGNRKNR